MQLCFFGEGQSSQSSHVPVSCDLLLLPWSPFRPLSSAIPSKGHTSVTAEEAIGFSACKLTPLIAVIYHEGATRSSLDRRNQDLIRPSKNQKHLKCYGPLLPSLGP